MNTADEIRPKTKVTNRKAVAAIPPKALAWTQHFEGRDFGTRFNLLSEFAKDTRLQPELLAVADHDKAMAIFSRLGLTMTREDLESHGSLKTGLEREKRLAGYQPSGKERASWLKTVDTIISTGGPMLGKLLAAYGEHIESVAANVPDPDRRTRLEKPPMSYSVAARFIYKANLDRSKKYSAENWQKLLNSPPDFESCSWESSYKLVNAINGCWLAHCCGIDPRNSAIYLIGAALDEVAAKDEKMPKAISMMGGRCMVKLNQRRRYYLDEIDDLEDKLCTTINQITIDLLKEAIENVY